MSDQQIPLPTARQIKAARGYFGWNQQEGADKLGVFLRTLHDFEVGKREPNRVTLQAMGAALFNLGIRFDDDGSMILPK